MLLLAEPPPVPAPAATRAAIDPPRAEGPEYRPGSLFAAREQSLAARLAGVARPVVSGVQLALL